MEKIAFIGFGHMGQAIARGALSTGYAAANLLAIDPSPASIVAAESMGIAHFAAPPATPPKLALICIKPQLMDSVLPAYRPWAAADTSFASIAAGTTLATLQQHLGAQTALVRVMPNTPAAIGRGISALFAPPHTPTAAKKQVEALLACVGKTVWLQHEEHMHAVTAVSGSGPAYVFALCEALQQAAEQQGLSPELAKELAVHTVYGAGSLLHHAHPATSAATLREQVTSKGGTTAAALEVLRNKQFSAILASAVDAATKRSLELS